MKVFVSGATGVVGRPAVRLMVEAGHSVTAAARSEEKAALLRTLGATAVIVDLFDPAAVRAAVAGHDAVVNLATHIPTSARAALPGSWAENDRIRREVSRNLVDAALATGATRYLQESVAFLYRDLGDAWIDEDTPLDLPGYARTTGDAEASTRRFTATGGTGVVLRFGMFYGADGHLTVDMVGMARRGVLPFMGPRGFVSSIHTDDAGAAVVAALRVPAGVYNVVDDEPLRRSDVAASLAGALGVRTPRIAPRAAGALLGSLSAAMTRSQRVSNRRFRDASGWSPRWRSAREAWPEVVAGIERRPKASPAPRRRPVRTLLGLLALSSLVVGLWAQLAPRSFYDGFPGLGRHWVSVDGPFNEHLVRDVGGLNLALFLLLATAVVTLAPVAVRAAAAAALVYAVPHLAYHLTHLDPLGTADRVANVVALTLAVVAPLVVLALARGGDQQRRRAPRSADSRAARPPGDSGAGAGPAVGGAAAGA
ncbi:MAG TPA: NAD(P)H-binding protein [Candidatus Dormibacteraeota bacterium]|nr:NAD(P)H-binding protein [Candidatus Dormibacteraeota bacterium]